MTIEIGNEKIDFKKCTRDLFSNEKAEIWKAFITLGENKIEFEAINECDNCNIKLHNEINWNSVTDFLKKIPLEIDNLKNISQINLLHLFKQMKFWKKEYVDSHYFYLDAIEYLSVDTLDERLKYSQFSNHKFQLIFTLESSLNKDIDIEGRWITKWTGNQLTGIIRE